MYSMIAFAITLIELSVAAISYVMQAKIVFYNLVVYGSPFYLAMNMLGSGSALIDQNPLYMLFIGFHVIKYFIFFRAQIVDDTNKLRSAAIVFEAIYLTLSAYYLI